MDTGAFLVCLCVCLSIFVSVYHSVCLFVCLSVTSCTLDRQPCRCPFYVCFPVITGSIHYHVPMNLDFKANSFDKFGGSVALSYVREQTTHAASASAAAAIKTLNSTGTRLDLVQVEVAPRTRHCVTGATQTQTFHYTDFDFWDPPNSHLYIRICF